jgi:hypothetical protein
MDPLAPALAVMVHLWRVKVAVTEVLEFIVTLQVGEVPEHAPDHPAKAEFPSGAAVRVTTVPAGNALATGFTVTVPFPVPDLETVSVYWGDAAWVMVRIFPPMVMVPDLEDPFGLAETEYPTVPFPLPLLPETTAIQLALLEALQEQPLAAVTLTLPVPPAALKDLLAGEMA